ncbi:MAG: hypothetical protein H6581_22645 [Bacteroidia bacterium]|nr:hypothetical protein [Bacteroidia bacterium]
MGKSSEELLAFILSLTPTEKRRIKQYSSLTGGDKEYIDLFDYLSEAQDLDSIRAHFEGRKFLGNLSKAFAYLFDAMLDALATFYYEPHSEIEKTYRKVKISLKKGSVQKAYKLIQKGIELSNEIEDFHFCQKFFFEERKVLFNTSIITPNRIKDRINHLRQEIARIQEIEKEFVEVTNLYDDLLLEIRSEYRKSAGVDKKKITEIKQHIVFRKTFNEFNSKSAKLFYSLLKSSIFAFEGDYQNGYDFSIKGLELFDQNRFLQSQYPVEYWNELHRSSIFAFISGEYSQGLALIQILESIQPSSIEAQLQVFFKVSETKLTYAENPSFHYLGIEACNAIENQEKRLIETLLSEEQKCKLAFLTGHFLYWDNQPKSSVLWINRLVYRYDNKIRTDLQAFGRLISFIILFETRDWEAIENVKRGIKAFIKQSLPSTQSINLIIKFIIENAKRPNTNPDFEFLERKLRSIENDPQEKRARLYFDYFKWLEKKKFVRKK